MALDLQNEKWKDASQKEAVSDDSCNKKDEESIFCVVHETLVSEGGEADLHKSYVDCKKNPGHTRFVPVDDFNTSHLPDGHQDSNIVELIKATADLTFRVDVTMVSTKRPAFWPNTNKPYPFYDQRGVRVSRLGTGSVWDVNKWTEEDIKKNNKGTCQCQKCQHSATPSEVWGEIKMYTATHVVFDDTEASRTTCRLFYDRQDSPLVTLRGWVVTEANVEEDRCELKCVTCDLDLLGKLVNLEIQWFDLWNKLTIKPSDEEKLIYIVSHPHGCPKQVSVGHWVNKCNVSENSTKYTYTAGTCPGSSGAYVHLLGYNGLLFYARHVHSGATSEGTLNVSGTGRD